MSNIENNNKPDTLYLQKMISVRQFCNRSFVLMYSRCLASLYSLLLHVCGAVSAFFRQLYTYMYMFICACVRVLFRLCVLCCMLFAGLKAHSFNLVCLLLCVLKCTPSVSVWKRLSFNGFLKVVYICAKFNLFSRFVSNSIF